MLRSRDAASTCPIQPSIRLALLLLAPAVAAAAAADSLGCFVEHPTSSTNPNMCERQFDQYLDVPDAERCAALCVASKTCVMFAWSLGETPKCRLSPTCTAPIDALPGFDGYFRNSTVGACEAIPLPPGPGTDNSTWTRVFLDAAVAKGAVCLDGSPGAYYIRTANAAGVAADPTKWVLFMEGGGWASSISESVSRTHTALGSSKGYGPQPGGIEGIGLFNSAPFDTHTIVYAKYCDGGSWTGQLSNPPIVAGNPAIKLFFRGRGLFDALFDDLLGSRGMDKARQMLYAGCSAGGLTTYIHADAVTATMKARAPGAKVVALADAMFSLNHDSFQADGHWAHFMQWVYNTNDPTGASVNEACVADMAAKYGVPKGNRSEGWRCMFGASVAPYVETPTFVLNSKYDTWQAKQIIGAGAFKCTSNIAGCPAAVKAFWVDYGHEMVGRLDALPARHGAYLHNCQSHCQTGVGPWTTDTVNGTHMEQAVATWYTAALQGSQALVPRYVDRCDVVPCAGDICNGIPASPSPSPLESVAAAEAVAAVRGATVGTIAAMAGIPLSTPATIKVSCVGDSITAEGGNMTYSLQLGRLLGPGYEVTNQGVSGHTMLKNGLCAATPAGSWRHPCLNVSTAKPCAGNCTYWGTDQFVNVTETGPDIITIMLGTNDAKWCNWYGDVNGAPAGAGTQFASDYVEMIRLFKALPSKPKVYVVLPPPAISQCEATGPAGNVSEGGSVCLAYNMSYTAINVIFPVLQRKIAQEAGADGVVDVWTALNGTKISTHAAADGIHPYPPALGVIAKTIAAAIATGTPHPDA